jgi:hypothetical protein
MRTTGRINKTKNISRQDTGTVKREVEFLGLPGESLLSPKCLNGADACSANSSRASKSRVVASEILRVPQKSRPCLEDSGIASKRRASASKALVVDERGSSMDTFFISVAPRNPGH